MTHKNLLLIVVLAALMVACAKDEIRYIDPMIYGLCDKADGNISQITSGSWNSALIGLRDQRFSLLNIKSLVENGGYTGDRYTLSDTQMTAQRVDHTLQNLEMKIDSVWNANIQTAFNAVNKNSAGIQNFGLNTYNNTSALVTSYHDWLMAEAKEPNVTDLTTNDFQELQATIGVLAGLAALNDAEVEAFVNEVKAKYAEMKQQYADLAPQIASSPYFSKGQKAIYTGLDQPLKDMQNTIDTNLSLATKAQLEALDRDLSALVYFVANNNTSPAQNPVVYGEISSITELRWLQEQAAADDYKASWVLTNDIDAAESSRWNGGTGAFAIPQMDGIFDGQNHIIAGLKIRNTTTKSGLFGLLSASGVVKNVGLYNADVLSIGGQGGVLVGLATNGTIINCFATGKNATVGQSGGLTGRCDGATITNCFASIVLNHTAANNIGGIMGICSGTIKLTNIYSTGKINNRPGNSGSILGNSASAIDIFSANGVYFDSSTTGVPTGSNPAAAQAAFNALFVDLPTASWGDLANFPGFSSSVWEIKTVPQIDANPRPYLKGFNYDAISDFIVP